MSTEVTTGACIISIMTSVSFVSCAILAYTYVFVTQAHYSNAILAIITSVLGSSIFAILEGAVGPGTVITTKSAILLYSGIGHLIIASPMMLYYGNLYATGFIDARSMARARALYNPGFAPA